MWLGHEILEGLLKDYGVDTVLWGTGEAKTTKDFLEEIVQGESYLRIDGDGILRVVEIVKMLIYHPDHPEWHCLLEVSQMLPDGRLRQRMQNPSGKLKRGESPEACLKRELLEELKVQEGTYEYSLIGMHEESRPSKSYPGLECRYKIHTFTIRPHVSSLILQEPVFTIAEDDDTLHTFGWENHP